MNHKPLGGGGGVLSVRNEKRERFAGSNTSYIAMVPTGHLVTQSLVVPYTELEASMG